MPSRQQAIYDDLRARLIQKEWQIGERLPAIAQLQAHYQVPGLNTIRNAQQRLVSDGYLRSEQGRGVYVAAIPSGDDIGRVSGKHVADAVAKIRQARQLLSDAEEALMS